MDDFYVYYELMPQNQKIGIIKAISPNELDIDKPHVRIPADTGKEFTVGTESLNRWVLAWDSIDERMTLKFMDSLYEREVYGQGATVLPFQQLPTDVDNPSVIVTWTGHGFRVDVARAPSGYENNALWFFVTDKDDPNVLHLRFCVKMNETPIVHPVDIRLPERFSVFTKPLFEHYQLRFET